ncbi:MAG TPA: DUF262 domain-containing protein [Dermatophilaceae bacterium]|jgi:hypothetical protein
MTDPEELLAGPAFGHHPWSVQELVHDIHSGQVRLPDLQRPFVWSNAKVRDLIDSMYRGYPVGELMFWANRDEDHTRPVGGDTKTQDATMQVIDGQQRLTSLYAVVKGLAVWRDDYTRERIRIAFNPLTERFEVTTPLFERSAEWIPDIVTVFTSPIAARSAYLRRLTSDDREVNLEMATSIELALNRLHQLQNYMFQVVQVKESIGREEVAEIFVRINSEGVTLSSADFILTWMSVFWEGGRTQLEDFARDSRFTPAGISQITGSKVTWTPQNPYMSLSPGQLVRVVVAYGLHRGRLRDAYNRLRGRDPRTREIMPEQRAAELAKLRAGQVHVLKPVNWDEFLKVLERAGFRSSEMITSANTVLYSYVIWLMGRVDFKVPIDELREIMARWFFMSQITGRYTSSPETRIQEDVSRIDLLAGKPAMAFVAELAGMIDSAVPSDWWSVTLPEDLYTSSTGAPAYVGYVAALNILDAEVLLSTMKVKEWINPTRRSVKGIERHHLFPKDYLKTDLGLKAAKRINQVANFALVEWSDNIDISNSPPHVYWPQQVADKNMDESRRVHQEEWHALPAGWETMEYESFLTARRRLMARVTHEGFKRLTDPNYRPDLTRAAVPAASAEGTLPTLEALVLAGVLPSGTLLSPAEADTETIGEITEDGRLLIGERLYESLTRAARDDGADNTDGWAYWQAHLDGSSPLLAELRRAPLTTEQA